MCILMHICIYMLTYATCVCVYIYIVVRQKPLFNSYGEEKARTEIALTLLCLPRGCLSYTSSLIFRVFWNFKDL